MLGGRRDAARAPAADRRRRPRRWLPPESRRERAAGERGARRRSATSATGASVTLTPGGAQRAPRLRARRRGRCRPAAWAGAALLGRRPRQDADRRRPPGRRRSPASRSVRLAQAAGQRLQLRRGRRGCRGTGSRPPARPSRSDAQHVAGRRWCRRSAGSTRWPTCWSSGIFCVCACGALGGLRRPASRAAGCPRRGRRSRRRARTRPRPGRSAGDDAVPCQNARCRSCPKGPITPVDVLKRIRPRARSPDRRRAPRRRASASAPRSSTSTGPPGTTSTRSWSRAAKRRAGCSSGRARRPRTGRRCSTSASSAAARTCSSTDFDWSQDRLLTYVPPIAALDGPGRLASRGRAVRPAALQRGRDPRHPRRSTSRPAAAGPTDEQLDLLVGAAAHAALALEHVQQAAAAERQRAVGRPPAARLTASLTERRTVDEMLDAVCTGVRDALGFEKVVRLPDRRRSDARHAGAPGHVRRGALAPRPRPARGDGRAARPRARSATA